ncbi:unnamed protein product, partial [Ectocarpus sp. 4 AP-2014]
MLLGRSRTGRRSCHNRGTTIGPSGSLRIRTRFGRTP